MGKGRYALLRERVLYIYANSIMQDASARPSGVSDEEYEALAAHRSGIISVRAAGGVGVAHRDARLALGVLPDGQVLIALTRFAGLGGVLDRLPFGLTTPETAALMGALGCVSAELLDGGVSGQLLVRDAAGEAHEWAGMRRVPLGIVAIAR